MSEAAITRLEGLAQSDPSVATLVRMQAQAVRASADPSWAGGVPDFDPARLERGTPLLHGQVLALDRSRLHALLQTLLAVAVPSSSAEKVVQHLDMLETVQASIALDVDRLTAQAESARLDVGMFGVLAQCLALPVLLGAGQKAAPLLREDVWRSGICPVCAAWPLLAELRGIERRRWLRCGRCGAGWQYGIQDCPFCANDDHRALSYLAPEKEREARRAATCDRCQGYVKTFSTLGALEPAELLQRDAASLELDVAAIERGYGRPEARGFDLVLRVEAAVPARAAG